MQSLNKIAAITLALMLLFASSSFTVNIHLCDDGNSAVAFMSSAAHFCDKQQPRPSDGAACLMHKKDCCSNKVIAKNFSDSFVKIAPDTKTKDKVWLTLYSFYEMLPIEEFQENEVPFYGYHPPLLSQDLQVLHQVFLI